MSIVCWMRWQIRLQANRMGKEPCKIYAETIGHGEAVILVHGWGMHSGFWREFAALLAASYRVTSLDLPGHGRSEMIDEFSLSEVANALVKVSPEKAHWIGWSLGASIVLQLAALYPERVHTLSLIAGNPKFTKVDDWHSGLEIKELDLFHDNLKQNFQTTLLRFLKLQTRDMAGSKAAFQTLRDRLNERESPHVRALSAGVEILKTADLRGVMAQLKHPLLILLGTEDSLVPVGAGNAMKNLCPSAQLSIIDKAGHIPFISHTNQTFASVSEFLRQHPIRSTQ